MAKNLAAGTTAADIESAMAPIGGAVLSCRLIAERPKVIAELVFETKEGADNVVETFNNQNADGNILQVYHKVGPVPAAVKQQLAKPAPASPAPRISTPTGPRADADRSDDNRSGYGGSDRYEPRDRSRERRYDRDDVMDGSYGFSDRMDTDNSDTGNRDNRNDRGRGQGQGLYSDSLINSRGRGRGNSWDRGRNNDRRGYR